MLLYFSQCSDVYKYKNPVQLEMDFLQHNYDLYFISNLRFIFTRSRNSVF